MSMTDSHLRGAQRQGGVAAREINSVLAALMVVITSYILLRWVLPFETSDQLVEFLNKFVGYAWPFFVFVGAYLYYVTGAWIVEIFALGGPRQWGGIRRTLHWSSEACPLVGLLTTFFSLLLALMAYGEAGPGQPETQAKFISQFAIAFGSSIAGGLMALSSFTLHRLLPDPAED